MPFRPRLLVGVAVLLPALSISALALAPFTEEAAARGIVYASGSAGAVSFGHGVGFVDLDQDGDPDVILVGKTDNTVGVYENDGTGHFTNRSATSGIGPLASGSGISAADYDGDGDLDVYLSNWETANKLLRNEGNFAFTDVAAAAGVADPGAGQGTAWGDIDGDGWLDLYVANRNGLYDLNRFYRNRGDGTFEDASVAAGVVLTDWTYQPIFFDHDLDGDPDLYISNDKCKPNNRLFENVGGTFVDISASSGTDACINSMGIAVGDFDRNLWQDLYATNTPNENPLFLNNGDGTYTESSVPSGTGSSGTGWGTMFFDYDNDAHLELYVCNQGSANRLYDHDGSWPATNLAAALGVTDSAGMTFGGEVADIDLDGDLDLLIADLLGTVKLYINHEGQTRNWIKFDVVGQHPNRFGVGALVRITHGPVNQLREVLAGTSFKSMGELNVHFGLGAATQVDVVQVTWPGGDEQRSLGPLPANQRWKLYPDSRLGDLDGDGDVRLDDFLGFMSCFSGALPLSLVPGCEMMDLDGDGQVDTADFDAFFPRYDGPRHDCDANAQPDLRDIAYGTAADADDDGVPDGCQSPGAPAGSVRPSGVGALAVARGAAGVLQLSWGGSCRAGDGDYAIYEGALRSFASHAAVTCTTDGATSATITPQPGDRYVLVVPHNGAREGSYGRSSTGERPAAGAACLPRQIGACP